MFDLVLFDLDGTLVETAPEITDAINELFARANLPAVAQRDVERWVGHGEKKTLEAALSSTDAGRKRLARGVDADFLHAFDACYFAHCGKRSRVYPYVTQILCALGAAGVHRAVLTNKEGRLAKKVLDAHGLTGDLELIVCGDTLPVRKPDPATVRHCLDHFGVEANRSLLIGDSQVDVATARAAGIAVWAVTYGYNAGQPVADAKPDRLLKSFRDLAPALTGAPLPGREASALVF